MTDLSKRREYKDYMYNPAPSDWVPPSQRGSAFGRFMKKPYVKYPLMGIGTAFAGGLVPWMINNWWNGQGQNQAESAEPDPRNIFQKTKDFVVDRTKEGWEMEKGLGKAAYNKAAEYVPEAVTQARQQYIDPLAQTAWTGAKAGGSYLLDKAKSMLPVQSTAHGGQVRRYAQGGYDREPAWTNTAAKIGGGAVGALATYGLGSGIARKLDKKPFFPTAYNEDDYLRFLRLTRGSPAHEDLHAQFMLPKPDHADLFNQYKTNKISPEDYYNATNKNTSMELARYKQWYKDNKEWADKYIDKNYGQYTLPNLSSSTSQSSSGAGATPSLSKIPLGSSDSSSTLLQEAHGGSVPRFWKGGLLSNLAKGAMGAKAAYDMVGRGQDAWRMLNGGRRRRNDYYDDRGRGRRHNFITGLTDTVNDVRELGDTLGVGLGDITGMVKRKPGYGEMLGGQLGKMFYHTPQGLIMNAFGLNAPARFLDTLGGFVGKQADKFIPQYLQRKGYYNPDNTWGDTAMNMFDKGVNAVGSGLSRLGQGAKYLGNQAYQGIKTAGQGVYDYAKSGIQAMNDYEYNRGNQVTNKGLVVGGGTHFDPVFNQTQQKAYPGLVPQYGNSGGTTTPSPRNYSQGAGVTMATPEQTTKQFNSPYTQQNAQLPTNTTLDQAKAQYSSAPGGLGAPRARYTYPQVGAQNRPATQLSGVNFQEPGASVFTENKNDLGGTRVTPQQTTMLNSQSPVTMPSTQPSSKPLLQAGQNPTVFTDSQAPAQAYGGMVPRYVQGGYDSNSRVNTSMMGAGLGSLVGGAYGLYAQGQDQRKKLLEWIAQQQKMQEKGQPIGLDDMAQGIPAELTEDPAWYSGWPHALGGAAIGGGLGALFGG
jgi:hypothetical protein